MRALIHSLAVTDGFRVAGGADLARNLLTVMAAVVFATGCAVAPAANRTSLNKEIAARLVEETLEKGNIDAMVDAHLSPDVEVEYPAGFKLPGLGTNSYKGADKAKLAGKAWKKETAHQIDVVEVIGEGDKVAVLVSMDRVFLMEDGKKVYNDHPDAIFFTPRAPSRMGKS